MQSVIELVQIFIQVILHLDQYLNGWVTQLGPAIYLVCFAVIFAETGLVVFPFLPGDSFLFALGALTAIDGAYLDLTILLITLNAAAILGDGTNYAIGRYAGTKLGSGGRFLNKDHLNKAHAFYERHGGRAIVIARFAPILRTFAPFVAGIARMSYRHFAVYNVIGGILWITSFLLAGRFFGNLPQVKSNFHILILGIIVVSLLPAFVEYFRSMRTKKSAE
ncbi:MAG: DedA family protein [Chitinophagaceae bacterium]|nr:DedA family protein [Oligoflexus sp.]